MLFDKVIGIGWDVGGWMGSNHGVAVCEWTKAENKIRWLGIPTQLTIPQNYLFNLEEVIQAVHGEPVLIPADNTLLVIGIDAPLGFPVEFQRLLAGENISFLKPNKEIENRLAYRHTDQNIYLKLGKKPLSASFDRIGNNATIAMLHTKKWETEHHFKTYPFGDYDATDSRVMIEVYPALVKHNKMSEAFKQVKRHLPPIEPGTDAYDACICALYAIAFGTNGIILPLLQGPPYNKMEVVKKEGWIYYFDKESLDKLDVESD